MSSHLCCPSCGSLNVGVIETDVPEWLEDLRLISGWDERGQPNEYLLWRNDWALEFDEEELEHAAESFSSVQSKTLKGYGNLVAAFKTHVRKGYHRASATSKSDRTRKVAPNY